MKIQTQTSLRIMSGINVLSDVPFGEVVQIRNSTIMRLKPVQFILNSTLICDAINRNDCVVCNLETGTVYIAKGDTPVKPIDATLVVQEK